MTGERVRGASAPTAEQAAPLDPADADRVHTGGRVPLHPRVRALTQQPGVEAAFAGDLALTTQIDRAHVVMLAERGILPTTAAARLLGAVDALRAENFASLRGRPAPRGWYLMYELFLTERLGPDVGGQLQLGRSRNDLTATLRQLKLRGPYLDLLWEALRLLGTLTRTARRYARTVMPAFTHHQPAVPITYGHYLGGVAVALAADIEALARVAEDLDRSPLGAGGVGGTTVPIDAGRTAALLGFAGARANSVEAVASRDAGLRLTAAGAVLGVLLGRVATDLSAWTGPDSGLLTVPDNLTSGSSMMPQKRNVFVLEHVAGKAAAPLGAFVTAATAMHKTPFSNAIAVHTEGMRPIEDAVRQLAQAAELLRLVVAAAQPDVERMTACAEAGCTAATEAANRLALDTGLGFRAAHAAVAGAVRESLAEGGEPLADVLARLPEAGGRTDLTASARTVAETAEYGGGPGPRALDHCLRTTRRRLAEQLGLLRVLRQRWNGYEPGLDAAVAAVRRAGGEGGAAGSGDRRAADGGHTDRAGGRDPADASTARAAADGRTT
ncbi:lyase family protein [Embleya sp. NPDC050493]|uniref:lyase family protein n=1 Tax=Embleya sp. NPDC050493 TaxID=3363989 RepID=UPI0037969F85